MQRKLILANIEDGIVDDGLHYYPMSTDDDEVLEHLEAYLYKVITEKCGIDAKKHFDTVGSWMKKPAGTFHKDLDLITVVDEDEVNKYLAKLDYEPFFYKGLSTWTFVIKDYDGIPRKIDIFKVVNREFSKKAYRTQHYTDTKWPSWSRNMILNAIAKVVYKEGGFTGRFIPYRGLCAYDENKNNHIVTSDWDEMRRILRFGSLKSTEALLTTIKCLWTDYEKDQLMKILSKDKKFCDLLNNNNNKILDIIHEIY